MSQRCFTAATKSDDWKVLAPSVTRSHGIEGFVIRGFHSYYNERRMQDVCHKGVSNKETMEDVYYMGDSHLLQDEVQIMCLSYKSFSSVTMREEW